MKRLDWQPFFDADRFEEFCAKNLADLDAVTHDWVSTGLFFQRIQQWRAHEPAGAGS
jgi:hypothetical protein